MTRRILAARALRLAGLLTVTLCATGLRAQSERFVVKVTDPSRDSVEVGKGMTVKGTASVPDGYHLWVLARREDFDGVWWPQAEGKVDPKTGEWKVSVTFGEADDIGSKFDVGVIVVDEAGHAVLQEYRRKSMKNNVWTPIEELPTSASGVL